MEPNQSPVESDNLGKKTKATLGKRKKQPLDAEAPKPKHADVQMSPKQKKAKQPSMPKEAIKEKELKKTPKKPEAKSFATPKAGKLVQSGKKPSKTPKQTPKKVGRPQSAWLLSIVTFYIVIQLRLFRKQAYSWNNIPC